MKVLLICPALPDDMPYLRHYLDYLDCHSVIYDLTYLCRCNEDVQYPTNYYRYNVPIKSQQGTVNKLRVNYKYSRFVINKLSKGNYTHVITMGIACSVFLSYFLKKKFPSKYIYDIRDYSQVLRIPIFRYLNEELLKHSHMNVISSGGFKSWLPNGLDYTLCHNTTLECLNKAERQNVDKIHTNPIRILTIGQIRDFEVNSYIIEQFSNNNNYELFFSGKGTTLDSLEDFVKEKEYKNVKFTGRYKKEEEDRIAESATFINVCMGSNMISDYLLSNRLYLAARLRKPLISFDGCYQAEIIKKYKLGVIIGRTDNFPTAIEKYIGTIDYELFADGCANFLYSVMRDLKGFSNKLDDLFVN